ncbi:tripartite tricarboxylate transporter substrate binding protein [Roseococcus sp. SYP-B2431]|uniref:Bug family tripartite tricarboxylate transporter substrate binding protein n=1 Tax=Roseococcus sp. SYP-B2431 TaxID=2496640 RepID=UPI0013F44EC6|nr:tripartite tricarboxylate transporter substrate binding protein [Roseococcus sp. SYP-B2431]
MTLVAPFTPGGAADIAARTFAAHAVKHMGPDPQAMMVENRAGASGAIGTQYVARARPDGQTLLLARVAASAILPAIDPRTPYRIDDFTWLGLLDLNPYVVCVREDAPYRDLAALLDAIRAAPGTLNFATSGPATILDLGIRHLLATANLPIDAAQAIPYRGGGEALASLLGGQAQFGGNNLGDMMGAIRNGQVRALVVTGHARLPGLRDVPTAAEAGVAALSQIAGWNALAGPAGMAAETVEFWARVVATTGRDPEWIEATRRIGSVPQVTDGAAARAHVAAQIELYRGLARQLNLG